MQNGVKERKLDLYGRRAIYESFTIAVIRAVYILCTLHQLLVLKLVLIVTGTVTDVPQTFPHP